jgi:diguanylate cyclase (GGDEF)-like protein
VDLQPAEIVIAIQSMQGLAALVLGALLWHFYGTFGHPFLRHWSLSIFALTVYLGASAGALGVHAAGGDPRLLRLALSALSLAAAYLHVAWLMIGTWEAVRQRPARARLVRTAVIVMAALGALSALIAPFDPDAVSIRTLLRVELRYALTGAAFLVAGLLLWRAQRYAGLLGARIGAAGFVLYGLQLLHVTGINLAARLGGPVPFYAPYVGLLDFLFQSIIGLGFVVWLLELQQRRTRRARHELEHARRHDPSTGLPNRRLLIEQIDEMMQRTGVRRVAVISLGMNRFARLNRALGWERTEQIVREVSGRLHESLSTRCAIGRIGDRDLVVVRPTLDDADRVRAWTEHLLGALVKPLEIDGSEIFATFCAGVALYPDDGSDPDELLHCSQHALVQSAQIGRDVTLYQHLERGQTGRMEAALRFEAELRRGLSERQFGLHFQPIVAVPERRILGFEALLRWHHPARGLLCPGDFLDEAASIGILDELEAFAIDGAVRQLARWTAAGRSELAISVNVSARRFQQPDLVERLVKTCRRFDVAPRRLQLEITENTALRDLAAAAERIGELHEGGISVALDDFGTGYSSLANLVKLPVRRVKLDREFLRNVPDDPRQSDLVAAMLALGERLGLQMIAEGVESEQQLAFLVGRGCTRVQGFFLAPPAEADQCELAFDASA